jgi:hypothetical protein
VPGEETGTRHFLRCRLACDSKPRITRTFRYSLLGLASGGQSLLPLGDHSGSVVLVERLPNAWDRRGYTSGQFVIYGDDAALSWLRRYYRLSPAR